MGIANKKGAEVSLFLEPIGQNGKKIRKASFEFLNVGMFK